LLEAGLFVDVTTRAIDTDTVLDASGRAPLGDLTRAASARPARPRLSWGHG
jgi:hypothetical protein